MNVGLLTLNAQIYNYGGLLQEYALCKTIEKLGHNAEIINYDVASEWNTFSTKRSIRYISYDKIVRQFGKKLHLESSYASRDLDAKSKRLFDSFREKCMKFSRRYEYSDLNELRNAYDGFVCGSDQIWNPSYNIPSFFLTFVKDKKKVIYAASVGVSSLSRVEKKVYSELLFDLKYISVREEEAKKMLAPLTTNPIEQVLDPTMLLDREEWKRFVKRDTNQKPYLFCYFLGNNKDNTKAARKFAKENDLELIYAPSNITNSNESMRYLNGIGPIEFLNLIYNADYILTDSFHASVFSIVYNKPFRVFGRAIGRKNMNGRITTLLSLIDRADLLILPENLDSKCISSSSVYNYSKIDAEKKHSIYWLERALKESGENRND